jgi:SNF2 family DNA or RNA helicase
MLSPAYFRSRLQVIAHYVQQLPLDRQEKNGERVLLRNGVIPVSLAPDVEAQIQAGLSRFSNQPLSFEEITRYNTWFEMHPQKVCGEEHITTSREFPIQIRGSKADIIRTIQTHLSPKPTLSMIRIRAKALQIKSQSEQERFRLATAWAHGLQGLEGLGELGKVTQDEITTNQKAVAALLQQASQEKQYKATDTLSFAHIVQTYNTGISQDEIRAWVWYKRSIGIPMKGWEKYYISGSAAKTSSREAVYSLSSATLIKDNHFRDLSTLSEGQYIGIKTAKKLEYDKETYLIVKVEEGHAQLSPGLVYVKEKQVTVERMPEKTSHKVLDTYVAQGVLFYLNGALLPYPIYAYGNMYDRELQLQADKAYILQKYGQAVYDKHVEVIHQAKPRLISLQNPDVRERPKILSTADFVRQFFVQHPLREEAGLELKPNEQNQAGELVIRYGLKDVFIKWLRTLPATDFREVSAHDIIYYYLEGHNLGKSLSEQQKSTIQKYTPQEGEALFARFLSDILGVEDQQRIDFLWNRIYNGQSSIPYHRVPIGFTCSAKFKSFNLHFTPAQREAIAFMEVASSGIIAYDVGVGKTMSAIITLAHALYCGKCSRPLVVVPNPTYGKWIKEMIGYTDATTKTFVPGVLSNTGVQLNEWYNLGTDVLKKVKLDRRIPANTITLVTYEGFTKIGFSAKLKEDMFDELAKILSQSADLDKSSRDLEKTYQKYWEMVGVGQKETVADIDTLGLDYIVIDEAHNFKNVFADVPVDEDEVKRYKITGNQSTRAIKAFFLCNYIQRSYGQNVMLLTATPFTNSPLEIYSMLSLVGYQSMRKMGIVNLQTFMQTFVMQTLEYVNSYDDTIRETFVVKSYNNRLILQKLIYNHIHYKTGEEAGVKRPCKVNLPRVNVTTPEGTMKRLPAEEQIVTYLAMSPLQRDNQEDIVRLAQVSRSTGDLGKVMKALGQSLDNALSPFLYKHSQPPKDYLEFVEESPKIAYVMACIRSVKAWHESRGESVSGQVIYMNRGKDYFPLIKQYLEKELGYQTKRKFNRYTVDEVEIISSGISPDKKEMIKEAFLAGVCKIIIGTATIREGIDLQKKGTVLYNCYPDWNPTDIKQIEGRIWRQGNEFGYVRSVMPLVQNSMDVFVFQKLEEKTSRINDIWYRADRGNVLDLESLDPEEVKFALFTNVDVIAQLQLDKELKDLYRRQIILTSNLDTVKRLDVMIRQYYAFREKAQAEVTRFRQYLHLVTVKPAMPLFDPSKGRNLNEKEMEELIEKKGEWIKAIEAYEASSREDKELLRIGRLMENSFFVKNRSYLISPFNLFSEFKSYLSQVRKAEATILSHRGYTIEDNMGKIIEEFEADISGLKREIEYMKSSEYKEKKRAEVQAKKEKLAVTGKTVQERADDFAKLNYLLAYKASEVESGACVLPEERKALPPKKATTAPDKLKLARIKAKALRIKSMSELDKLRYAA